MSTKLNLAASIAFAWNSLTVDQYAARKKNPDLGQPSLFETSHQPHLKDLGAGRWITIHAGQGESGNHGGHAVFVGDDGKMKTGKFAGKSMSEAFGARKPKDKRITKRGGKHEQGQPGLFETEAQPTLPGVGPGNFIDQEKLRALGKEAKEKEPKPGLIPGSTSVKNEDAKAGDQLGLFGEGEKAKPKPWKPTLLDTKGKAGTLFDTKGDKDQMLAFDVDGATPEDRLQKPKTSEKKPDQAIVNVPLAKRGNIDNQIDKFKAEQAAAAKQKRSESFQQKKVDKAKARELFDQHADALAEATAAKGGNTKAEVKKHLDSMVKWQPAQAVKMLEDFAKQQAGKATMGAGSASSRPSGAFSLAHAEHDSEQLRNKDLTASQLKEWFDHATENNGEHIKGELSKKTVAELKKMGAGGWHASDMKKSELVDDAYNRILGQYHVGQSYQWDPMSEKSSDALRRVIGSQTDEHVRDYQARAEKSDQERAARRESIAKAVESPQSADDWKTKARLAGGYSKLSSEDRAKFDESLAHRPTAVS